MRPDESRSRTSRSSVDRSAARCERSQPQVAVPAELRRCAAHLIERANRFWTSCFELRLWAGALALRLVTEGTDGGFQLHLAMVAALTAFVALAHDAHAIQFRTERRGRAARPLLYAVHRRDRAVRRVHAAVDRPRNMKAVAELTIRARVDFHQAHRLARRLPRSGHRTPDDLGLLRPGSTTSARSDTSRISI